MSFTSWCEWHAAEAHDRAEQLLHALAARRLVLENRFQVWAEWRIAMRSVDHLAGERRMAS